MTIVNVLRFLPDLEAKGQVCADRQMEATQHHEQREEAKTCQAYKDTTKPPNDTTYGEL